MANESGNEKDWDSSEPVEKLEITAPEDWKEYDEYLLEGGRLEYEHWRSLRVGIQEAEEGKTCSMGSFAQYAEIEGDECEAEESWFEGLEAKLAIIFKGDLDFYRAANVHEAPAPYFRGAAIEDVIAAIKKLRQGEAVDPGSFDE